MTKFKKFANKIFISILVIISFLFAQTAILFNQFAYPQDRISSMAVATDNETSNFEELSEKISNNSFKSTSSGNGANNDGSLPTNYTGNTKILNPNSWSKDGVANASMFVGVINIEENTYKDSYTDYHLKIKETPRLDAMKEDENGKVNVLMINSETKTTYGYKSSSITLDANSFYSISVKYYTGNTAGTQNAYDTPVASICLYGDDFEGKSSSAILATQTNKNWGTATFWIATNKTKTSTAQLGLYLGAPTWTNDGVANTSAGYVFFDDVKLLKHSENYFNAQIIANDPTAYKANQLIDLSCDNITSGDGFVADGSFTNTPDLSKENGNWTLSKNGSSIVQIVSANAKNNGVTAPNTNARVDDDKVLMVYNPINKTGSSSGSVTSSEITINQHTTYRISFWAKTNSSSIDAKLEPVDKINGNTYSAATITTSRTSASKTTNDWNEYVFYVTGNSLVNSKVKLTLGLTSANNVEEQYAFFDNITSQKVSTEEKDNAGNVSTISYTTLNLNPTDSGTIANGYFNIAESSNADLTYPLAVSKWSYEGKTTSSNIHGIVNLKSDIFDANKQNFGNPSNPSQSFKSENVLMFYNNTLSNQTYTSDSNISVSASKGYKLTIDIFTSKTSLGGGANIYLKNSNETTIAQLLDINTNNTWQTYSVYFNNYANAQTLTLSISFGREQTPASGWAYFDNCVIEESTENFNELTETPTQKIVNLSKSIDDDTNAFYSDSFKNYNSDSIASYNKLNEPFFWKGEMKAEVTDEDDVTTKLDDSDILTGIINYNNISSVLGGNRISSDIHKDALMIYSPTDAYYASTNNLEIPLASSSYYKLSVSVKTVGLSQKDENQKVIDDEIVPFGASISIDGITEAFTGINTNGNWNATDDGWLEYTFYINTTDALKAHLSLGLGSENAWTSGWVFFDDVVVQNMTEDEFNLALNLDLDDKEKSDRVINIMNTTAENEENTTPSNTYYESLAWLSIPTVIIGVAIIVALAGYCIKKYLQKRPVKVKVTNNYDRSATLLKELDHRNYKTSVNHRLKLLYEELDQTKKYLEEEKAEHQKQMEAYETAKEIAENDKSIQLETPNKKYFDFDKTVEQLEKNIASIKADIEILEEEQKQIKNNEKQMRKDDLKGNKIIRRK